MERELRESELYELGRLQASEGRELRVEAGAYELRGYAAYFGLSADEYVARYENLR